MLNKSLPEIQFNIEDLMPLRDRISTTIRSQIIEGKILPGERLTESDVANILGVSRTPLREAFFQLHAEGFVKFTPRKGAIVSDISIDDATETYEIKTALEGLAARLATRNVTAAFIEKLIDINDNLSDQILKKKKDIKLIFDLNGKFHQMIIDTSGNKKLSEMLFLVRQQTQRYNYIYLSLLSRLENSISEHVGIINALKEKNPDKAEKLIKCHSESAQKILCDFMISKSPAIGKA
jgi:DNA-binding GntR family transcriptional regulator